MTNEVSRPVSGLGAHEGGVMTFFAPLYFDDPSLVLTVQGCVPVSARLGHPGGIVICCRLRPGDAKERLCMSGNVLQ